MFLTKFALWWSHCKQHRSDIRPFPKAIFQGGHSFFIDTAKPTQFKQFSKRQKLLFKPFDLGLILNLLQLKYLLHVFLINYVIFKSENPHFSIIISSGKTANPPTENQGTFVLSVTAQVCSNFFPWHRCIQVCQLVKLLQLFCCVPEARHPMAINDCII